MVYDKEPVALLAVFPHERLPEVDGMIDGLGVPRHLVHVGTEEDERASLRAEQNEEARESVVSPQAGVVLTKEPAKALTLTLPLVALAGVLIAVPFAFIEVDGLSFWSRVVWYAIAGAASTTTIAFIVTAAMAAKDPFEPGAAQRGVVVRVDDVRPEVERALSGVGPLRIDRLDEDGAVLSTVVTEEDLDDGGIIEEVEENVQREQDASPTERHR